MQSGPTARRSPDRRRAAELRRRAHQGLRPARHQRRAAVGGELAIARQRERQERAERERDQPDRPDEEPEVEGVARLLADDRGAERARHARERHHDGVAVRDVRELVRKHRVELVRLEQVAETTAYDDDGSLTGDGDCERVRVVGVGDLEPRWPVASAAIRSTRA